MVEMVKRNMAEEDIYLMRQALQEEGWASSKYLPARWMSKSLKHNEQHFLTGEGELLQGYEAVKTHVQSSDQFSQEDRDNLKMFLDIQTVSRRSTFYDWKDDDESIPLGWKSRFGGSKQFILSPDGQLFPNRRACLEFMIKTNFEEEEIEEMRSCLVHEGWETNPVLPKNWLFKKGSNTREKGGAKYGYAFVTHLGDKLMSVRTAIEYVMKNSPEKNEDIRKLGTLSRQGSKTVAVVHNSLSKPRKCEKLLNDDVKPSIQEEQLNTKWLEDDSLPEGWRLRRVQRAGVGEVEIFLTTSKEIIASRHMAINHIVKNNYDLKDILKMRSGLKRQGWEEDEKLPPGFLVKKCNGHGEKSEFYTPENQLIEGVTRLLEHLLEQGWGFSTTSYVARMVNWKKVQTARRTRLQGILNNQMEEEGARDA